MSPKLPVLLFLLIDMFSLQGRAQQTNQAIQYHYSEVLSRFSRQKSSRHLEQKKYADSVFYALGIPLLQEDRHGNVIELQRFIKGNPLFYTTHNLDAAKTISVYDLWSDVLGEQHINGAGAKGIVWDGGGVNVSHQEFVIGELSRVAQRDNPALLSNHSTHVVGTMVGSGVDILAIGMASGGHVFSYDFNNDISEIASEAADGNLVSNHSYGTLCGWRYDYGNEMWYWYGDYSASTTQDLKFGLYNTISHDVDFIMYNAPKYLLVKSAGNDRGDGPTDQPIEHVIWDGNWVATSDVHELDGGDDGYDCLSHMAVAKNNLVVGSVEDIPNGYLKPEDVIISSFSSWGPTDDGRIKPDIVANGSAVYSCSAEDNLSYLSYNGTSMAAASISGSVLLLHQVQEYSQPGVLLNSATVKGLLLHTADECGEQPGPDYIHGWGLANVKRAVDLLLENRNSGGHIIREGELANSEQITYNFSVLPGEDNLKITLVWTDPPADTPNYCLDPVDLMLVNDLNISLQKVGESEKFYPWILDPDNPSAPATRGINYRDNVEQIYIENPVSGEYQLTISHAGQLFNGMQEFSLITSGIESDDEIVPPTNLSYISGDNYVRIDYNYEFNANWTGFNIYRNGLLHHTVEDTFFIDRNVVNNLIYNYYVTAVYEEGVESISTNTISAKPQKALVLPYFCDFEEYPIEWTLKHSISGWRYGNSDSLTSYYLDFTLNQSNFIAVDSYTAQEGLHVSDYGLTPVFDLEECENVKIGFDYHFVTGIYGAVDELKVMYKLSGESDWVSIAAMERTFNWTSVEVDVPAAAMQDNIVFALYYDDLYRRGMGGGIDNFSITGQCVVDNNSDIQLVDIEEPSTACSLSDQEIIKVRIRNNGPEILPVGAEIDFTVVMNGAAPIAEQYFLTRDLMQDSTVIVPLTTFQDMKDTGDYILDISVYTENDSEHSNNFSTKIVQNLGNPSPIFLGLQGGYCRGNDTIVLHALPEGGSFNGAGVIDSILIIDDFSPDTLSLSYHYIDSNNCVGDTAKDITLYPLPSTVILLNDTIICSNSKSIDLYGLPANGVFTSECGIVGNVFSPLIACEGVNLITYEVIDEKGCSGIDVLLIDQKALPEVGLAIQDTSLCQNADSLVLSASSSEVIYYGEGVQNESFFAQLLAPGQYWVYAKVMDDDGCINVDSSLIEILPNPVIEFSSEKDSLCIGSAPIEIIAMPTGGELKGDGLDGLFFTALEDNIGKNILVYSVASQNGCESSDSIVISVLPTPTVQMMSDTVLCSNSEPITLEGYPEGGVFSAKCGVDDNTFSPLSACEGINVITYVAINEYGCENVDSVLVDVEMNPMIELSSTKDSICVGSIPIEISATPANGILTGSGVDEMIFIATDEYVGDNTLIYSIVSPYGCESSDSIVITVLPSENIVFFDDTVQVCDNDSLYSLTAMPAGGQFSGPGVNDGKFDPQKVPVGEYYVTYEYTGFCQLDSLLVEVLEAPTIDFILDISVCQNSNPFDLNSITPIGDFSGVGVVEEFLIPTLCSVGANIINYQVMTAKGCSATKDYSIAILPVPEVSLGNDKVLYLGESLVLTPETDAQFLTWYNGAHTSIIQVNSSELGLGPSQIYLTAMNSFGCSNADTVLVEVRNTLDVQQKNKEAIKVSPNPFKDNIFISLPENRIDVESIEIFDQKGNCRAILDWNFIGLYDLSFLDKGVYILQLQMENKIYSTQIIKL